ncbi:MAG: sugar ABC transporter permease [Clostridia bacterium]|nr:sugar ABC transporter permease [Clostridia bacterium]
MEKSIKKQKLSPLKRREHLIAMGFISFKYVGFILFVFLPVLFSILYSFANYNAAYETEPFLSIFADRFSGFETYKMLFNSRYADEFKQAILNNLFLLLSVPMGILLGILIAAILSRPNIKGSNTFRLLIYMPVVASAVAMNVIWRYMFDNQYGLINKVLGVELLWLSDDTLVKIAIVIKNSWGAIGRTMILCLAAMYAVDDSYYEAARLDGAGEMIKFFKITLPLITPTLFYLFITGVINNLQIYTDSLIFASGDKGARTVVYFIWQYGIRNSLYGFAAAASTLLTITIMAITIVQFRFSNRWVFEG